MTLAERDQVVQTFAANRADRPLANGVRLGGSNRRLDNLQAHPPDGFIEPPREFGVAVANQVSVRMIRWYRFPELLERPVGRRMPSHIEVKNPSSCMLDHNKRVLIIAGRWLEPSFIQSALELPPFLWHPRAIENARPHAIVFRVPLTSSSVCVHRFPDLYCATYCLRWLAPLFPNSANLDLHYVAYADFKSRRGIEHYSRVHHRFFMAALSDGADNRAIPNLIIQNSR
jgi:hypothetical protein